MGKWIWITLMLLAGAVSSAQAADQRLLLGFETKAEMESVEIKSGGGALSTEHATQGRYSLRVPADDYLIFFHLPRDWSGYDALEADVYCDVTQPMSLYVLIGDEAWQNKSTYWNRYNGNLSLRPGPNTISIPLGGLYRGEAGSRFNDLKTNIDPSRIVRLDLGFKPTGDESGRVYLDNLRLVRWSRPASVRAFDFGPAGQSLGAGFTPVSPEDAYTPQRGWGWEQGASPGRAWDVTFPTRLLQDSIDFGDAGFQVDLPNGKYRVVVFFEGLGYWSGEQARYTERVLYGRGWKVVENGGKWGKLDYICHFQDTEPVPGADLWDVYMSYLFRPVTGEVTVTDGQFELKVRADGPNARRVAALILYPAGAKDAEKWAVEALFKQRDEFRARAVELPLPKTKNPAPVTPEDRDRGYQLFLPRIEDTVYFSTQPRRDQLGDVLQTSAAQGERRSLTVAIRPLEDLGEAELEASDLRGEAGVIPRSRITVSVVRHLPTRGLGTLMYRITPRYLVAASKVNLPKDLTRQFWLTVEVPEDAAPGEYQGKFTIHLGSGVATVPIRLQVLPFKLEEADFLSGFWDIRPDLPFDGPPYDAIQAAVFRAFRERGFTSFSGGPPIRFLGLDGSGHPVMDFAAADKFMAQAKAAGFRWEFNNYGGFVIQGLYDIYDYTKGQTGAALEKKYGLPFEEIARRVWTAVEEHAKEQHWLPFSYTLCDETRTAEKAKEQLELMKTFNRVSPWLKTAGGYSVSFAPTEDPLELTLQDFFRVLDVSIVNDHDETLMKKARELGKEVYIYNQGRTRYSFGLYQWSEREKGVSGRYEWISSIRHGYEYFDLDGREPDPSMIFFSSEGVRPSLALEQCAEGMNDFRYLQTLEHWIRRAEKSGSPEAKRLAWQARLFLEGIEDGIALNQREQPDWLDLDEVRDEAASRIVDLVSHLAPRGIGGGGAEKQSPTPNQE